MSLIKCKECGKDVSNTALSCPHCGCLIKEEKKLKKEKKNHKKIIIFSIIIAVIVLLSAGGLFFFHKHKLDKYKENYEEILDKIVNSASITEDCLVLYRRVWYNTIFEEDDSETDKYTKDSSGEFYDDFNDSLFGLWISEEYKNDINKIKNYNSEIAELFKNLKNPPREMKDAFEDLEELYDVYLSFTEMAIDPSGSLTSFTERYNELDNEIATLYNKAYRNIDD